jgi:hypothetical protein
LIIDNGGEFCGNEFKEFYKKCGIARSMLKKRLIHTLLNRMDLKKG